MNETKQMNPLAVLIGAFVLAVTSGSVFAQDGPWRIAGGVSVPDATVPAGRVSDAVHSSRINDADARVGVYVELARTYPLDGDFMFEVEGGLGYNSAKGTGRIGRWSTSASGYLFQISTFGNLVYTAGPATFLVGAGGSFLWSNYDKHTVLGVELDAEGGGDFELAPGIQTGVRIRLGDRWYTEYKLRVLAGDKHDTGAEHLILLGTKL